MKRGASQRANPLASSKQPVTIIRTIYLISIKGGYVKFGNRI
jgi:hypothetical protein